MSTLGDAAFALSLKVVMQRVQVIQRALMTAARLGHFQYDVAFSTSDDLGAPSWWWDARNLDLIGDWFAKHGISMRVRNPLSSSYPRVTFSWYDEAKVNSLVAARHTNALQAIRQRSHSGEFCAGVAFVASGFHGCYPKAKQPIGSLQTAQLALIAEDRVVRFTLIREPALYQLRVHVEGFRSLDATSVTLDKHTLEQGTHFTWDSSGGVTTVHLEPLALSLVQQGASAIVALTAEE